MPGTNKSFGAPKPLPGQPGFKTSETERMEREAREMEARLKMLKERMEQQQLDDDAAPRSGGSRWKSARPDKGTVLHYAKDVQEKHKKRSENPSMRMSAHAPKANTQTNPQSTQQTEKDFRNKDVDSWGVLDVKEWLRSAKLGQYAPSFVSNDISGPILLDLTLDDLDY
eukprot:CAMPEP_0119049766 /NCGR_PEP_ID=MMETSP1177-20130426/66250_1 /TAXON_ID=2985 /ORGANISM="Ochromonas sp, Strain CCMP1899" /LENGTH=168 /DNA_ID=CAMNT_0007027377 /DNA_START=45 /DNA_END=548 /DNA_ORIENTATION=+